jgi:predicted dehydrogenase
MNTKIRVGVIGASAERGWARMTHIPAIQSLAQYQLTAVCTTRIASAKAAAEEYGAPLFFDNYAALIDHPDIDMVTVSVKAAAHYKIVTAALKKGKHVYCEWPLGNGLPEAKEMALLAREMKVHTAIGLQGRTSPMINKVKELVASGYVGKVLSTSMVVSGDVYGEYIHRENAHMLDVKHGSNFLTIQFGHFADVVCYCLGEFNELAAITATQRPVVKIAGTEETVNATSPDQIVVHGVLKNGTIASIHLRGGSSRATNLLWEINGTSGDLRISGSNPYFFTITQKLEGATGNQALSELIVSDASQEGLKFPPEPASNVARVYANFASDIQNGTKLCATFDDAFIHHQLIDAVQKSALNGKRVLINTSLV